MNTSLLDKRLLVCRNFDKYDDDSYKVIEVAFPVEVCECGAYKIADKNIDSLAEAILDLINIEIVSDIEIAKTMDISVELVKRIKRFILLPNMYISNDLKTITDAGKKYLQEGESTEYQSEYVFGNMFISIPDGEVMPYFLEGRLPGNQYLPKEIYKIQPKNDNERLIEDPLSWSPKFTKAYKLFQKISRYSEDEGNNEFEFAGDELNEVSYLDVNDEDDEETFADVEAEREAIKSYKLVRILNTGRRQTYIKMEIIVNRENPEKFTMVSPFGKNITNWFTKRLGWLSENDIKVEDQNGKVLPLAEKLHDLTDEFYIQFPELQAGNFDYWVKINYTNLKKIKCGDNLLNSFRDLFNLTNLYDNGRQISEDAIINKTSTLIETIFNNYIAIIDDRRPIIDKFYLLNNDFTKIKGIFKNYGIESCVALKDKKLNQLIGRLRSFRYYRVGDSIVDRYFFLTLEAYFCGNNPFKMILQRNGKEFIEKIDSLFIVRSEYGAHSDEIKEKMITKIEFEKFKSAATEIIKLLINTLYEREHQSV